MKILDLADQPQHLATLAAWHHAQWGYLNPTANLATRIARMQAHLSTELVPSTFVAVDTELLGSASIINCDMDDRVELTPWLASVFVAPEQRRQGVGSELVRHVMDQARQAGVGTLYLFTPDQQRFYQRLGWRELEQVSYRGYPVTIMCGKLGG